jgi:hypothetical protein
MEELLGSFINQFYQLPNNQHESVVLTAVTEEYYLLDCNTMSDTDSTYISECSVKIRKTKLQFFPIYYTLSEMLQLLF